jgi:hypothetical protein
MKPKNTLCGYNGKYFNGKADAIYTVLINLEPYEMLQFWQSCYNIRATWPPLNPMPTTELLRQLKKTTWILMSLAAFICSSLFKIHKIAYFHSIHTEFQMVPQVKLEKRKVRRTWWPFSCHPPSNKMIRELSVQSFCDCTAITNMCSRIFTLLTETSWKPFVRPQRLTELRCVRMSLIHFTNIVNVDFDTPYFSDIRSRDVFGLSVKISQHSWRCCNNRRVPWSSTAWFIGRRYRSLRQQFAHVSMDCWDLRSESSWNCLLLRPQHGINISEDASSWDSDTDR